MFVGYRYYDKKNIDVLFPFGYGLSYTTFAYSDLKLDKAEMQDTDTLTVTVKVKNTARSAAKRLCSSMSACRKAARSARTRSSRASKRSSSSRARKRRFRLRSQACVRLLPHGYSDWYVESGAYTIMAAKSSREIACTASVQITSTTEIKRVYTMDSTVEEIMESPTGRAVMEKLVAGSGLVPSGESEGPDLARARRT